MGKHLRRTDAEIQRRLVIFGRAVRACREMSGLSQQRLEELSGVDQTSISRLERGVARGFSVARLATLSIALDDRLALGTCPHRHDCRWRASTRIDTPDRPVGPPLGESFLFSAEADPEADAATDAWLRRLLAAPE